MPRVGHARAADGAGDRNRVASLSEQDREEPLATVIIEIEFHASG